MLASPVARDMTINEWLHKRHLSRAHWYRMPPKDKPDVIGEGKAQRITKKADEEWEARQIAKGRARSQGLSHA
jgi:hypothetical protein